MYKFIGVRIANLRKRQKMEIVALSKGIISIPYLSKIENGRKIPSIETLLFLADRLNVPAIQLVLDEENLNTTALKEAHQVVFQLIIANQLKTA